MKTATKAKGKKPAAPALAARRPKLSPAGRAVAARLMPLLMKLAADAFAVAEAFGQVRAELSEADREVLAPLIGDLAGSSVFVAGRRDELDRIIRRSETAK